MKKFLSMALALAMTMSMATVGAGAKDFADDGEITYKEAVDVVSALKIVDGYDDGAFQPATSLNRGQAAKIICNLVLGPTTASALTADTAPFKDVPTSHHFSGYIAYCAQQGIISGYADGTFKPAGTLTTYAFMKMLLGALGYKSDREGYTGGNWSVQVAKTALGIELDNGLVNDFSGQKAVNREEACLYAFNTLQANMVTYGQDVGVVVNGATVNVNSERTWDHDVSPKYDGNIIDDDITQFAERYFTDLVLDDDEADDFYRPSNKWFLDGDEIGSYAKAPDASYDTGKATMADIYLDANLTGSSDTFDVYIDGLKATDYGQKLNEVVIEKGNEDEKIGTGNGNLIQVYKSKDAKKNGTISIINTYIGEVVGVEAATSKRDAYVELGTLGDSTAYDINDYKVLDNDIDYDTEGFEVGDIVTLTYSFKNGKGSVKSVALAESATGEVENFTANKKFTMAGTSYDYGEKKVNTFGTADVGTEATVYMDSKGYVLYYDEGSENLKNYAFVMHAGSNEQISGRDYKAYLLYTDGDDATVDTDKDYTGLTGEWVTYKTNSKGKVVLTSLQDTKKGENVGNFDWKKYNTDKSGYAITDRGNNDAKLTFTTSDGKETVKINSTTRIIIENSKGDFNVYEGVKNMPKITGVNNALVSAYTEGTKTYAKLVYIKVFDGKLSSGGNKAIFLVADDGSKEVNTANDKYYVFDAVVEGELIEDGVMLDATDTDTLAVIHKLIEKGKTNVNNMLLTTYSKDSDGLYTVSEDDVAKGEDGGTLTSGEIEKVSGDTIDFDGNSFVVADDCVFYRVDGYNHLKKSTMSALRNGKVGDYYAYVAYTVNNDQELTGVYWQLNK